MPKTTFLFVFILSFLSSVLLAGNYILIPENRDTLKNSEFQMLMQEKHLDVVKSFPAKPDTSGFYDVITEGMQLPLPDITIMAVGDIMPGTNYPSESYLPRGCSALFLPVKDLLSSADVAIGNLEGVFSSSGGTPKKCKNPETCYVFRMPDEYASCIKNAGFDMLSVANNHVNDFGVEGRRNTAQLLNEEGISFAGFQEYPYAIYAVEGLKIGFCAFAPHIGTLNFKDYEKAADIVQKIDSLCDIVVVSFHGGAEGKDHQHITREDEIFLGYNRGNPWYFSHRVIDAGADLVIGHGPHVVRAIEFYKGKLIAYSLGNFCTYARFNLSGPNANAPVLEVRIDRNGDFRSGKIHSFLQLGEGGPVPDPTQKAMKRIRELSIMDFPEKPIQIDLEGNIIKPSIINQAAENN
jgi:poly-gamma-glutamate capsule biosynthesis protein CapA/YwtB (metallophosphatase superfamily)